VISPTAVEVLPDLGDHVQLIGTNIVGDVRQVIRESGCDRVTFKVTSVLGKSSGSKTARALRGAWITCGPGLLVQRGPDAVHPGGNMAVSEPDRALPL
jgi:hypothetical protein